MVINFLADTYCTDQIVHCVQRPHHFINVFFYNFTSHKRHTYFKLSCNILKLYLWMVSCHRHRKGPTAKDLFQRSYNAWSHSHSSCAQKKWKLWDTTPIKNVYYISMYFDSKRNSLMFTRIHWPDAVVIGVDVIRFVELSIMQAGAQVSCHTFSRITQILSRGTETTLLTHFLLFTARFSTRQRTARPVTHTSTGLVYLASSALQRWQGQIRRPLINSLFSVRVDFYR